jgi:hypothetical protein
MDGLLQKISISGETNHSLILADTSPQSRRLDCGWEITSGPADLFAANFDEGGMRERMMLSLIEDIKAFIYL